MTTKIKIAALAAVMSAVVGPAFAGDQDLETLLRDSGRYVPQINEPASDDAQVAAPDIHRRDAMPSRYSTQY